MPVLKMQWLKIGMIGYIGSVNFILYMHISIKLQ